MTVSRKSQTTNRIKGLVDEPTTNGKDGKATREVSIPAPRMDIALFTIRGNAPFVQNRFSQKAKQILHEQHAAGSTSRKGKKKDPKDFDELYRGSMYESRDGWRGLPASAFRNAMVSACRLVGFKMTLAKLSVFVLADGFDKFDGTPLIRITKGEPHQVEHHTRNATGVVDLRSRAMWDEGWEASVRIRFDRDQFTPTDVANLLARVGLQVGIGEGRPDSKQSTGMGWGTFDVVSEEN